jgi:molybdenum cofactor biosynthesis protein B
MSTTSHKKHAPKFLDMGILSVSTTRTLTEDKSGKWIAKQGQKEGHNVVHHQVIPDDMEAITDAVLAVIREKHPQALLLTGGTGISPMDVTIESVIPLFEKELSAFGPLFAQLSYEEIGSAALLSRSTAGIIEKTLVFCIPGSLNACKLACGELIFPELGHLVKHMGE